MLRFGKLWINLILNPLITIWDPFECIEQIYYTDMEIWLNWKFFLNPNYLLIFTWKIQTYTKYLLLDPKYLFNLVLICISKESTFIYVIRCGIWIQRYYTKNCIGNKYWTKYTFLHWIVAFYTLKSVVLTFQCCQQPFGVFMLKIIIWN